MQAIESQSGSFFIFMILKLWLKLWLIFPKKENVVEFTVEKHKRVRKLPKNITEFSQVFCRKNDNL
jgi:hypothetical protein